MKVLLINPLRENEILGNNPSIIEEERGFNPPLGILYVAGYLEKYSSHDITVIDAQVEQLTYKTLEERIRSVSFDVVGVTAMTMTLIDVIKTIEIVKKTRPDAKVILGGPHVHLFPDETISLKGVDYLVLGEGEIAFHELLHAFEDKKKLRGVKNLVFKDNNGEIVHTGIRPTMNDLDDMPFPARHLVPYRNYSSLLARGNIVTTIITSRGCPFQCAFCDRPHLGKTFRARSSKNVVDELEECVNMGIADFLFYDDTFTINKQRVIDICHEIQRRQLDIRWDIRARIDTVDQEVLVCLKNTGCCGIHYGIEAGTEKALTALNKNISIDMAKSVFNLTRKCGIPILAYFMIGNPGETRADIMATFDVMKRLDPDYVHICILTPFPGTKIYDDGLKNGILKKDHWREFARNPSKDFLPPYWEENFTREELKNLLIMGYQKFYLRPSYMMRRLLSLRSFGELKRKAKAGLKIFSMD